MHREFALGWNFSAVNSTVCRANVSSLQAIRLHFPGLSGLMGANLGPGVLPLYGCNRGLQPVPITPGQSPHGHQNSGPPQPAAAVPHSPSLTSVTYSAAAVARSVLDRLQSAVSGHHPTRHHPVLSLHPSTVPSPHAPAGLRLPSSTAGFTGPLTPLDVVPDVSSLRPSPLSASAAAISCASTSMLLRCPTPHYASLNFAAAAAAAAAAIAAAETRSQQMVLGMMSQSSSPATSGGAALDVPSTGSSGASAAGDAAWLLAKSSSIAELRLRAKQYIAGLDLQ